MLLFIQVCISKSKKPSNCKLRKNMNMWKCMQGYKDTYNVLYSAHIHRNVFQQFAA